MHRSAIPEDGREPAYPVEAVERLLGLREHAGPRAVRDLTILDIMSWAQDPGGFPLRRPEEPNDWQWRRGPLQAESPIAVILWDFERAMKKLLLLERALIALTVFRFTQSEIAQVLGMSQQQVGRLLRGRPKRDGQGKPVRDPEITPDGRPGPVAYVGGLVPKVARLMSGADSQGADPAGLRKPKASGRLAPDRPEGGGGVFERGSLYAVADVPPVPRHRGP